MTDEDEVSRLLADVPEPAPMPPEVAARLDRVLAELVSARSVDQDVPAPVVVPPERRRRWPKLLLAAAAVLVAGYGVGGLLDDGSLSGSADSATSAEAPGTLQGSKATKDRASSEVKSAPQAAQGRVRGDSADSESSLSDLPKLDGLYNAYGGTSEVPLRLRSAHLQADVVRYLRTRPVASLRRVKGNAATESARSSCAPPVGKGRSVFTKYDGEPAVLILDKHRWGFVGVRVVACTGAVLADTVVIAP